MDGGFQAYEYRLADQEVTDIQLPDMGNGGDGFDIFICQAMPGMDFQADAFAIDRRLADLFQQPVTLRAGRIGISAGMQFHHRCAQRARGIELTAVRLDEHGDTDTRRPQRRYDGLQAIVLAHRIDAALGGALLALFRHDAGGMGPMLQGNRRHLVGRRHFQIERNGQRLAEPGDIVIGNMAPVFAQVGGDAVGAGGLRQDGGAHRIGIVAAARLTHGRHMIDIHAEAQLGHAKFPFKRVPGSPA
jgi:hypothetical protein